MTHDSVDVPDEFDSTSVGKNDAIESNRERYLDGGHHNTLGHALMVSGEQGAAAVLGATALTDSQSDIELGQRYLPRITQPGATIGDALLAAKRDLAQQHPEMRDVIVGWTILGDPALVVDSEQP